MKYYEVYQLSTDPCNEMLRIYKQGQPICDIENDDFIECLTEPQYNKFIEGKFEFRTLPITKIKELSKKIYA